MLVVIGFTGLAVEQSFSVPRSVYASIFRPRENVDAVRLRVATINCNSGDPSAVREAFAQDPDIVFLQESPNEQAIQELAQSQFGDAGSYAWSADCTIIARGRLQATGAHRRHFMQATLTTPGGKQVEVASVRLSPPLVRYDLWNRACWSEHARIRRVHRDEATALAKALSTVPASRPIVIAGDCNAPAGDGAFARGGPLGYATRLRYPGKASAAQF